MENMESIQSSLIRLTEHLETVWEQGRLFT